VSPLLRLEGHSDAQRAIARGLQAGRLPQVLLLHGPRGTGKQRFAHWIGQLLVCSDRGPEGPCGVCRDCGLALRLEHPDLHAYVPLPRPKRAGSVERDVEAFEELRAEWIEEARKHPLRPSGSEEVTALHLGIIRGLNRRARSLPSTGPYQLFLLADAEQLAQQESAQEAANALLKTLEEPSPGTHFVLTSSEPGRLLPTLRSRASSLYLPALPVAQVADFLVEHQEVEPEAAERAARLGGGAIGRALGFLPAGGEDGPLERVRKEAFHLLRDALSPRAVDRYARALAYPPSGARGLLELLGALEGWIRDLGAAAAGAEAQLLNPDARNWLVKAAEANRISPIGLASALERVEQARTQALGNVNPQLLLMGLLFDLQRVLPGL
jgi:DNA polymerase III subunit delta'